jgi:hypothetical protein
MKRHLLHIVSLLFILALALGLRLLVWQWRELYALGGDEQEYLQQALTILQQRRYEELLLMRPPLYAVFLATAIYFFDSLVQNLRLVQAIISTASVGLVYLLAAEVARWHPLRVQVTGDRVQVEGQPHRVGLVAATLAALSYTLAVNATELLTETLFLAGLTLCLWMLLRGTRTGSVALVALSGLTLGALCLLRSVGLPLLALGVLWLVMQRAQNLEPKTQNSEPRTQNSEPRAQSAEHRAQNSEPRTQNRRAEGTETIKDLRGLRAFAVQNKIALWLVFALCTMLVVAPWTLRNYVTYGGLIIIDTTGAENLWLDNDPAGREAVKAQLFALGEDRLARQQLASQEGMAAILADPQRFAAKAWGEAQKFFALEYSDDMRDRPEIWLPPLEVWLRLILGDALWLFLLCSGGFGLIAFWLRDIFAATTLHRRMLAALSSPAALFVPWCLYILLTGLIFHVELRYRLPLYPALLPYTALLLCGALQLRQYTQRRLIALGAALPVALCLILMLLHRPYPALAWQLANKHRLLAEAETFLQNGALVDAQLAAARALAYDDSSALARVTLARSSRASGDMSAAEDWLNRAESVLPAHPYAHLLRGDLRRNAGQLDEARAAFAYENSSREDLQAWSWRHFASSPTASVDVGDGLDLGFIGGFHKQGAEDAGFRWTTDVARLRLSAPAGANELVLRLASGRPAEAPAPTVQVAIDNVLVANFTLSPSWQDYVVPLEGISGEIVVELRSPTFRPRQFTPDSADGRRLGMMIDHAELRGAP